MGRLTGAVLGVPEEQRDAPQTCQPHKGIDDPGENGHLAAKEKGNGVKAEQPYAAPVQRADDHQNQRNFVNDHVLPPVIRKLPIVCRGFRNLFMTCKNTGSAL